jgi:hypothetical protein
VLLPYALDSVAGPDTPLAILLGAGVLLFFTGILVNALAVRNAAHPYRDSPLRALFDAVRAPRKARRDACRTSDAAQRARRPEPDPVSVSRPDSEASALVTAPTPGSSHAALALGSGGPRSSRRPSAADLFAHIPEPEMRRLSSASLAPLGRMLERSRRLRAAEDRVAAELAHLPEGFWLIERYVLVASQRVPFVVAGATGVFVICPTDGACGLEDLEAVARLGTVVGLRLPADSCSVRAGVCLAFDEMQPRTWFGGAQQRGAGAWMFGLGSLRAWLFSFGPDRGLLNGDVRRLHEAASPIWSRRAVTRLPSKPQLG